jgi:hypothetical protein
MSSCPWPRRPLELAKSAAPGHRPLDCCARGSWEIRRAGRGDERRRVESCSRKMRRRERER